MKATIEEKGTHFKLTVAKDRVAIKVPIASTEEERNEVIPFLQAVADKIVEPEFTHRGTYDEKNESINIRFGGSKYVPGSKKTLGRFCKKDVLLFTS